MLLKIVKFEIEDSTFFPPCNSINLPLVISVFWKACKFDFEDGISGWIRTGTEFNNQPTYGDNPTARTREPANQQGDWWIGGYEHRPSKETPAGQEQGDVPQGTLTSPCFYIKGNNLNFLLGGGCNINLARAELIVSNQVSINYIKFRFICPISARNKHVIHVCYAPSIPKYIISCISWIPWWFSRCFSCKRMKF